MKLSIIDAGISEYEEALVLQKETQTKRIKGDIPDTLILLEHPPVITLGRRAAGEDILISPGTASRLGVRIVHTDRGGEVTYHGPGQLVGYLICELAVTGGSIKRFVRLAEESLIRCLEKGWGVRAGRKEAYIGVWAGEEKIAALGLSVSRRVTMHGFALNVNTNLEHFRWIVPCGIRSGAVTSLQKILGREIPMEDVKKLIIRELKETFGYE
jgi:lipoyl(octanoyl) transferase